MTTGSGLKNLGCFDTRCWGQGRQCGSTNNIRDEEEPAYENEQDTHTQSRYVYLEYHQLLQQ